MSKKTTAGSGKAYDFTMPPPPTRPFFLDGYEPVTLTVQTATGTRVISGQYTRCHNHNSFIRTTIDGTEKMVKLLDRGGDLKRMQQLAAQPVPHPSMLWVEEPFTWEDKLGYVTGDFSGAYIPLNHLFGHTAVSDEMACKIMQTYAQAMGKTHEQGWLFNACHGGENCYVDPQTGDLLVGECEKLTPLGQKPGDPVYRGRFAAPELILDSASTPDVYSNRHFLAAMVFYYLFRGHPLEGQRAEQPVTAPRKDIHGTAPVFVFDPEDTTNAPLAAQKEMVRRWTAAPDYVRALFRRAFSQEALHDPSLRPTEAEFEQMLGRYRQELTA